MSDEANTARPDNFDRLRSRGVRTTSVTLALEPNDADRLREARKARDQAKARLERATAEQSGDAQDEYNAAQSAYDEIVASAVTFTVNLQGVGPRRVEELMAEYPPTQAQRARAKKLNNGDPKAQPNFDEDRMPPVLLSEAITSITFSDDPEHPITELSVERMTELWSGRWSVGDRALIFQHAMMLDQAPSSVEALGKG